MIFVIERNPMVLGYDEYDKVAVLAKSEEEALELVRGMYDEFGELDLTIKVIDETKSPQIILDSFNAG